MCFSATASFAAGAVLIPAGIYSVARTRHLPHAYWAIAMLPVVFGVQQVAEGFVWSGLQTENSKAARSAALIFLFFSHFFWLFWIPLCCYFLESRRGLRLAFILLSALGALYGGVMYFPVLMYPEWLQINLVNHSIAYELNLVYDGYLPRLVVRAAYAGIVLIPLLTCSNTAIRWFGVMILVSVIISRLFFDYAFVSIWCYFAALLSIYIVAMIEILFRKHRHHFSGLAKNA